MANIPDVGVGKQTAFGSEAASLTPIKVTAVDPSRTENRIDNDEMYGGLDQYAPEQGTYEASVTMDGRAYPEALGYFLQMVAGNPVTTGADPYTHVFTPGETLPPRFTVGLDEDDGISVKILDALASDFTLTQEMGAPLTWSINAIGSDRVAETVSLTGSPESGRAFRFDDFTATVDGSGVVNFKSLSLTVTNPVSNIFTLNGERSAATQEYTGRRTVELSGTMRFVDDGTSYRAQFEGNTSMALVLTWAIDANATLTATIPDFRITDHNWTRGFDETEVDFSGAAFSDGTKSIQFELVNSVATY